GSLDHPRARGARRRLPDLLGRGSGGAPVDVRSARVKPGAELPLKAGRLLELGGVDYREALALQRRFAAVVADGAADTVLFLEQPPAVAVGRRVEADEVQLPDGADVDVVEVDRGGKSTYHAPGQLVCYPILDLTRHGQDVRRYCRDLEEALIRTLAAFALEA